MNIQKIFQREVQFINSLELSCIQKVKLYQSLYRSVCYDSSIYSNLHGSTSITQKGTTILFGDGVDCIGKTTTALEVAKNSNKFVVDEFTIFNELTGSVYGNPDLPLCLRRKGELIHKTPKEFKFETPESIKLNVVITPHPAEESYLRKETDNLVKLRKLSITANAHHLKFCDNGLDRGNGKEDKVRIIEIIDHTIGFSIPKRLCELPYYDAYLKDPKDIIDLLKKEGL